MTSKIIAIVSVTLVLATAFALLVKDYLHACRCERCARPYAIFTRSGMEVCRTCKNALDALAAARTAWFKAKRLNA